MILTGIEALTLLQLPEDKLSVVEALIPPVQQFIIDYTNNHFEKYDIRLSSNKISFSNESPALISDSESQFIEAGFVDDLHIRIQGSKLNDGIYQIELAESDLLTLKENERLLDETEENTVIITAVIFPNSLKLAAAKLIGYDLQTANMKGIASRSLGDYSESYISGGDYPKTLLRLLAPYKKLSK